MTFTSVTLPSLVTTNWHTTRPWVPASLASAGYLRFCFRYSISLGIPPGNSGICSTTSYTCSSEPASGMGATVVLPSLPCAAVATSVICASAASSLLASCVFPALLQATANKAAAGRNSRYLAFPALLLCFLFIIVILFFNGKTLKLFDKGAIALGW